MQKTGLYESLVTESLQRALELIDSKSRTVQTRKLHPGEVGDRLALHLGKIIISALSNINEKDRVELGTQLVRDLIGKIESTLPSAEVGIDQLIQPGAVLSAVLPLNPDGTTLNVSKPLTPLLDTILLTNARGEPRIGAQILGEIDSADRIDIVMAFIRRSGIRPFISSLERYCGRNSTMPRLRILTTTYTGSTELKALEMLQDIGAKIKVSYDTSSARLHAKAWHFHRDSGASTAYIGSSNITYAAQESGIEWNVRISGLRNPDVLRKITSMFESYWSGGDFRDFNVEEYVRETSTTGNFGPAIILSPIELRLEPFQERLLEQISVARGHGHHRNLLVSATGTGKTVMAAADYARLRETLPRARLLFVAHREEIIDQSLATFRHVLRDAIFGEKWVGRHRPVQFDHVFASIQTLHSNGYENLEPDHFDVVIVDEFHHAAALSYERLLFHTNPKELLGLTATPERGDGLSILGWFKGRIAAELRLWDAIDQHRLVPFIYYGIYDGLDLRDVPWRRGRGYDTNALSNLYTADDVWVRRVIEEVCSRVNDVRTMKALGFCVNIQHAQFMASRFMLAGIQAVAVWGETPEAYRRGAIKQLVDGEIQIIFSVDLFSEGVDVPSVDTLLLLRPTESATLFMQQLGRGLRKAATKSACTVLDFVGIHRKEFRFDLRLSALMGGTRKYIQNQVEKSFPFLPAGCHMELDVIAKEVVLNSLKSALPVNWNQRVQELRGILNSGIEVSLQSYLQETGLELSDIYSGNRSWSDLLNAVELAGYADGPQESMIRRAIGRMLHIDDEERLEYYIGILDPSIMPDLEIMTLRQRRLVRMLVASMCDQVLGSTDTLLQGLATLWKHPQVIAELRELFYLLLARIEHIHHRLDSNHQTPLQVHGRYTRIEILCAFGVGEFARVQPWQAGVLWIPGEQVDVLVFTLDKSGGDFSPNTMYRDYAISRDLIHWESQSGTRAESATGKRYRNHVNEGSKVMLFARETANDRAYWFIGPAVYVSHESERPMGITWRLKHSLPGDLFSRFAAAVA